MAYFPNGTEGMDYEARYCDNCVNHRSRDGEWPEDMKSCPIWDLHYEYNYDQNKKTKTGKIIGKFLSTLIPMQKEKPFAAECSMFLPVQEKESEYARELREANAPVFGAWQG